MAKLNEGDRVRHNGAFLKGIGALTGEIPAMRGELVGFKRVGQREFAVVIWEGYSETRLVMPNTLERCHA